VISANPIQGTCAKCGYTGKVYAAVANKVAPGRYELLFGSAADFCPKCEEPWVCHKVLPEKVCPYCGGKVLTNYKNKHLFKCLGCHR
jgi:DNA-directed RNA polymerase subunit RPC12/RpoP